MDFTATWASKNENFDAYFTYKIYWQMYILVIKDYVLLMNFIDESITNKNIY